MNTEWYAVVTIAITAVATFITRLVPFALFGGNRQMPDTLTRLAGQLPPAIMAVLIVYCLKTTLTGGTAQAATWSAVAAVVLLHLWRKNTLLSIAGGTVLYMILIRVI